MIKGIWNIRVEFQRVGRVNFKGGGQIKRIDFEKQNIFFRYFVFSLEKFIRCIFNFSRRNKIIPYKTCDEIIRLKKKMRKKREREKECNSEIKIAGKN